jgi:hypothetical protein
MADTRTVELENGDKITVRRHGGHILREVQKAAEKRNVPIGTTRPGDLYEMALISAEILVQSWERNGAALDKKAVRQMLEEHNSVLSLISAAAQELQAEHDEGFKAVEKN